MRNLKHWDALEIYLNEVERQLGRKVKVVMFGRD